MISNRAFATAIVVFFGVVAWGFNSSRAIPYSTVAPDEARLLADMNYCLYYGEVDLRGRYANAYQQYYQHLTTGRGAPLPPFASLETDAREHSGKLVENMPCSLSLTALGGRPGTLDHYATAYARAFDNVRPDAAQVTQLYREWRPDTLQAHELDRALTRDMDKLHANAEPFQQALEAPLLKWRLSQLEQINTHEGHDQHWYTLSFLITARQAIDQLDDQADHSRLRGDQIAALHTQLLAAWSEADGYFQARPKLRTSNNSLPPWITISPMAKAWIDSLAALQQHWAAQADPIQLGSDLTAVDHGYDELIAGYNNTVALRY